MRQIRARIRDKRGVDYTEEEIRELANVKLEKFLDPRGVRSGLLEEFQRAQAAIAGAARTSRSRTRPCTRPTAASSGGSGSCSIRMLKLFFNPESADPGAAHPVGAQHSQRQARGARRAALRGHAQPRARADAARHRGEEPEDARRVDVEPARLRRASRPGARGRGHVSARRGRAAAAACRAASRAAGRERRRSVRAAHAPPPPPAAAQARRARTGGRAAGARTSGGRRRGR